MRDEIRDVLDEQTPGERNALFREGVMWCVERIISGRTEGAHAVPLEGEQQERTLRMVNDIIRRHRGSDA